MISPLRTNVLFSRTELLCRRLSLFLEQMQTQEKMFLNLLGILQVKSCQTKSCMSYVLSP